MRTIALEDLSDAVRAQLLEALEEPVVITEDGEPIVIVQSLLDDEIDDDLIARHPEFRASIARARARAAAGQGKTLADLRREVAGN